MSHFLDAVRRAFAPWCVVCGVERGDPVCPGCLADFFPEDVRRCRRCGNRLPSPVGIPAEPDAVPFCGRCLAHAPPYEETIALADYAAPVSGMIAALKFQGRLDLGRAFGALLARRAAHGGNGAFDALIPVPLSAQRLRGRGYNQADEIARAVSAHLRRPVWRNRLVRVRDGPPQHALPLAQRRVNIRGSFAVLGALPATAKRIALVDDVMTSGSTLGEAAATLRRAGVERVVNLVVARTP